MTSNFEARKHPQQDSAKDMDSQQRDRFELISAFIDGEVTAAERKQVQELLVTDPDMQRLHSRLLMLRQGLQNLPIPASEITAQQTAQQVFSKIDRRRNLRTVIWGGGAIAALFVSALSGMIFPGSQSPLGNFATNSINTQKPEVSSEALMIAVNRPLLDIPKAAMSSPKTIEPSVSPTTHKKNFN
jgi:ferric-dicitrate binding protein FerR (iron transport regulator)